MKARQQADPPREDSQRELPLPIFFFFFFFLLFFGVVFFRWVLGRSRHFFLFGWWNSLGGYHFRVTTR